MAVSEEAWLRIREIYAQAWREIWAVGHDGAPAPVVGLVVMQALRWDAAPGETTSLKS